MSNEYEYKQSREEKIKNVLQSIVFRIVALVIIAGIFYSLGGGFHFGDWISPEFSPLFYSSDWLVFGPTDFAISFNDGDSWWGVCMRRFLFDNEFLQVIEGCFFQVAFPFIWLNAIIFGH